MKSKLIFGSVFLLVIFILVTATVSQSASARAIGTDGSHFAHPSSSRDHVNQLAPTAVITVGGTINTDTSWTCGNVYYVYSQDVTVSSGVTLTIESCAIVKFQNNRRLFVAGKLMVTGTSGQPVYFTSYRDDTVGGDTDGGGPSTGAAGDWGWIEFTPASDDASLVNYAVIRYGGAVQIGTGIAYRGGVYLQDTSPTINITSIFNNQNYGIYADASTPALGCNNIYSNGAYGLYNATPAITVTAKNQW